MSIWLTSDLHFSHDLVARTRGFDNTVDHDVRIQRNWQRMVNATDVIWVLGDISAGSAAAQMTALDILRQLPGVKYLVAGNHDSVHPKHRGKAITWDHIYRDVFTYICSQAQVAVDGHRIMLSHFPYTHDRGEARYMPWRLRDEGLWLAHGHTHEQVVWSGDRPREFHVGLDAHNLKPVNLGEIAAFIKHGDPRE